MIISYEDFNSRSSEEQFEWIDLDFPHPITAGFPEIHIQYNQATKHSLHTDIQMRPTKKAMLLLLTVLFLVALLFPGLRLAGYAIDFWNESIQLDFSAYYTAGQSLNAGLSPYENNVDHKPPIWDGFAYFKYSRFLYPPLVASLFQPLALFSYRQAKLIWIILILICVSLSLLVTIRSFPPRNRIYLLALIAFTCLYHPLITHLERGQIDAVTLLIISLVIIQLVKGGKTNQIYAGILLALAVLIKLYSLYLIPIIMLRKHWHVLKGFVFGVALLFVISLLVPSSRVNLYDYAFFHFPRIANIGEYAQANELLADKKDIRVALKDIPIGMDTVKDGCGYRLNSMEFNFDATLVEPIRKAFEKRGMEVSGTLMSICLYLVFLAGIGLLEYFLISTPQKDIQAYLYWFFPFVIVLLVSPLTWVMNLVWFLPLAVLVPSLYSESQGIKGMISIGLIVAGLMLAAIPDFPNSNFWVDVATNPFGYKYVVAEAFILAGILTWLVKGKSGRASN
jgi:hypothetical protein